MASQLAKAGLYVDDLNKLRIIDPSLTQATVDFKDECLAFLSKTEDFHLLTKTVFELFQSVSSKVERMKLKTICSRNRRESMSKERLEQQEILEARLLETRIDCERLRIQLESLQKQETEQREFIQHFLMYR